MRPKLMIVLIILSLTVQPHLHIPAQESTAIKNVILMIGDGMGEEELRAGSLIEYGNNSGLFIQRPEFFKGKMTTNSANKVITDSAASATAMATGWKVNNGRLSLLNNGTIVETILEYSQAQGKKTGLVTTTYFYHATPAAFASHQDSRYNDAEIITKMINSGTDLILAGGLHQASLADTTGFDTLIQQNNYSQITNKTELSNLPTGKILGTFGLGNLEYEANLNPNTDVRLHEITSAALDHLVNENGFFLMIEGGRIDHGGHENNITRQALEVIEFDYTIQLVYEWVESHPDTLVIVTGDHETGGLSIISSDNLDGNLPQGSMTSAERSQRRIERSLELEVSYSTTYHTSQKIPIFSFGAGAESVFTETQDFPYDNTDIYRLLRSAIDGEKFTEIFEMPTTSMTSLTTTSSTISSSSEVPTNSSTAGMYFPTVISAILLFFVGILQKRKVH